MFRLIVAALLLNQLVMLASADEKPRPVGTVVIGTARSSTKDRADLVVDGRDDGFELRKAFARLGPQGGTVRLLPGRYRLDSSTPVQVPSNTTLDGGGNAIIECSVKGQHGALWLKDVHDVVIRGVRFESSDNDSAAMFAMMNVGTGKSRDVTIRDCHFAGFKTYALRMNQPGTRFRFIHNHLRRMGCVGKGGSAINGARMIDSLIGWNFVEHCGVDAGDWAIYVSAGGARNLQIVGNTIRDCAAGIKDLGDGSDRKILIARNVISGIRRGRSIALGGCRNVLVTGNMITMGNGAAGIGTETTIHQVVISNNIIDMNGKGSTLQPAIGVAADDSTDISIINNQVSGGGPNASCIVVATVKGGLIANNLLRVGHGKVGGVLMGGCGIRIGRLGTPHAWHLLVTGNLIQSPVSRNAGIQLTTGKATAKSPPKSDVQLVGNTIRGFQFAITLDRNGAGRYRNVVIRGNTSSSAPLVGKMASNDERITIESNTSPKPAKKR